MQNKRNISVILALLTTTVLITGSSFKNHTATGDELFRKNCKQCHGSDGTKGMFGAKNLKVSGLEIPAIIQQIRQGKGIMPSFKKKFSEEELAELANYVVRLRE